MIRTSQVPDPVSCPAIIAAPPVPAVVSIFPSLPQGGICTLLLCHMQTMGLCSPAVSTGPGAEAGTDKGFLISFLGTAYLLIWCGLAGKQAGRQHLSPCLGPLALHIQLVTEGLPVFSRALIPLAGGNTRPGTRAELGLWNPAFLRFNTILVAYCLCYLSRFFKL